MKDIVIDANQMFQLAALGPCLFIVFYIIMSSSRFSLTVLPVLFFLALSSLFLIPILQAFPEFDKNIALETSSIVSKGILPVISFLLILQFTLGKFPPPLYWLIFAIPFVGGGPLIYLSLTQDSICIAGDQCYRPWYLVTLYEAFGSALMFMLLVFIIGRSEISISKKDKTRRHKYWLIITLVAFNLMYIATDLALLGGVVKLKDGNFIKTMIGVGFVYLVLSSIFRVFSESLGIRPWTIRSKDSIAKDRWLAERITWILREESPYRNLGFNRKAMADLLGTKEHTVSRVINERFGKTFSELMNECRIHDAKKALRGGTQPITVISYDSGFSSLTSFNRVFKEATGVSPSDYRKGVKTTNNDNEKPTYYN